MTDNILAVLPCRPRLLCFLFLHSSQALPERAFLRKRIKFATTLPFVSGISSVFAAIQYENAAVSSVIAAFSP
jgi:hypothetical protein